MRGGLDEVCGCFPTGRHYPGLAEDIAAALANTVRGLVAEIAPTTSWAGARLAIVDFETTGLEPERDRVIEVGIVIFDEGGLAHRHHWLVNPGIPVPDEARAVHGITDEELAEAPPFEEVFPDVVSALVGAIPVAYNAEFDRRFLQAEAGRLAFDYGGEPPPALREGVTWVDPLVWVRELQKEEKSKKLSDVCERLSVSLERAHRAAGDAEATGRVLLALASRMPRTYSELVRIQGQYAAHQDVELSAWRTFRR